MPLTHILEEIMRERERERERESKKFRIYSYRRYIYDTETL